MKLLKMKLNAGPPPDDLAGRLFKWFNMNNETVARLTEVGGLRAYIDAHATDMIKKMFAYNDLELQPSMTSKKKKKYKIEKLQTAEPYCHCPAWKFHDRKCKHIMAIMEQIRDKANLVVFIDSLAQYGFASVIIKGQVYNVTPTGKEATGINP